ncbi:MAG: sulfatase-like hydrolase/transferase [Ruminococcus sp.]|nr:sulfatase-like hydrolase/transferase [Ruminococcus sp.]
MKRIGKFLSLIFLTAGFAYFEALLRAFGGEGFGGYACAGLFAVSAGLILSAVMFLLPQKASKICTTVILAAAGLAYTAEALVKKNFMSYMSPESMFSGAKGVVTQYTANLAAAAAGGIPQILLFSAPAVIYGIVSARSDSTMGKTAKIIAPAVSAVLSVGLFFGGSALSADSSDMLGDFSRLTESFGLTGAVWLNISGDGGESGNGESGFVLETADSLTLGLSAEAVPALAPDIKPPAPVMPLEKTDETTVTTAETVTAVTRETETAAAVTQTDITVTAVSEKSSDTAAAQTAVPPKKPDTSAAVTHPPTLGISQKTVTSPETTPPVTSAETTPEPAALPKPAPSHLPPKVPNEEEAAALALLGDNVMDIDFDGAYARNPNSTVADLNQYVQALTPSNKNIYTGLFAGKNLILICAEAFSDAAVDEQLTPTLYRMTHNGIYFSNYYQPTWGGSTTTGEFSFVTGLVPEGGLQSMQKIAGNNNYFTLGNGLQRKGYSSGAFHNGSYDYYSRNLTHKNLGYHDFLAFGNGLENYVRKYCEDSAMIDKTVDLYLDCQPFSLYYMTVSGHFSYKADNVKVKENLSRVKEVFGDKYMDKTNYYFCYQMELDKAMEMLIAKLEAAGIADNTVICITADHYPYGLENNSSYGNNRDYIADLYGCDPVDPWERDRNSWILWSGCLENDRKDFACEVSAPTYSLDIVPTLYNLFGLEFDSRLMVGRDVFSDAMPLALWNNLSWVSQYGSYNSKTKQFTPLPGYTYDKDYVSSVNAVVKNKIYYSKQVVNCDYYGALFGKDEIT